MSELDGDRSLTFGSAAEAYDRWRPTYPDDAVDFLAPRPPARVLDVGAGTGQLTGLLLARGLEVDAVDADHRMLRVLLRNHPAATAHAARAEALPFADASVDAVLVATAFHWFPFAETVAEVRRVLRPGGSLGLVYNLGTPVHDWERELGALDPDRKQTDPGPTEASWDFPAGAVASRCFPWDWQVTPEHVRNHLATHSGVMRLTERERSERLDAAEAIVRRACGAAGSTTVPLHHEAFCLRWIPAEGSLQVVRDGDDDGVPAVEE